MFNAEPTIIDLDDLMEKVRKHQKVRETVVVLTDEQFDLLIETLKPDASKVTQEALLKGIKVYKVPLSKYAGTIFELSQTKNVILWRDDNDET